MTRIACAALYHYSLHETMTLPYSSQLEINTVHINDVCRAMWFCTNQDIIPSGTIFNLSDKSFTTQETVSLTLSLLFKFFILLLLLLLLLFHLVYCNII